MQKIERVASHDRIGRSAKYCCRRGTRIRDPARLIEQGNGITGPFHQGAKPFFAVAQRFLGALALDGRRDLRGNKLQHLFVALFIANPRRVRLDGQHAERAFTRLQRHAQPIDRRGADRLLSRDRHVRLHQERLPGTQDVVRDSVTGMTRRWWGVHFIHKVRERDEILLFVVQGDVETLCGHQRADDLVNRGKERLQIGGLVTRARDRVARRLCGFGAGARRDVVGDDELSPPALEDQFVRGNLDDDGDSILATMAPDTGAVKTGRRTLRQLLVQHRDVVRQPQLVDRHGVKFVGRVLILRHGGTVDRKDSQRFEVVDPHRGGRAFKERPITLLRRAQRFLRPLALGQVPQERAEGPFVAHPNRRDAQLDGELAPVPTQRGQLQAPIQNRTNARFGEMAQSAPMRLAQRRRDDHLGQWPSGRLHGRPSEHRFRLRIPSRDVAEGIHGDVRVERGSHDRAQPRLGALALDGVADHARQQLAFDASLHEVVLCAGPHCIERHLLVVQSRDDHDRFGGKTGVNPRERFQALAVGQAEIEQDDVDAGLVDTIERRVQTFEPLELEVQLSGFAEQLEDEPRVPRVVFDEEDSNRRSRHRRRHGSLTISSQNAPIAFTAFRNTAGSIGFVTYAFALRR